MRYFTDSYRNFTYYNGILFHIISNYFLLRPWLMIGGAFNILINALLFAGLAAYGDDTGAFDEPYRVLSSALAANGDLFLWYPFAGDGVPILSLEVVGLIWNPLGVLLGAVRPYDFLSLAAENLIWRLVGFAGAYQFARKWGVTPIGATAIAATYVGSGTMGRAALSFVTLIGQMLAPWILVGGSLAIQARTRSRVVQAGAALGLAAGAMVWAGYAATWVIAPALSGPVLVGLASTRTRGLRRLVGAAAVALPLALLIAGPVISETLYGPTGHYSPTYRAKEATMLVGHVRAIDFIGMWLANPSYVLVDGSDALQPLYGGILPPLLILATVRVLPRMPLWLTTSLALASGLILANTQNWSLWDHPQLRDVAPTEGFREVLDTLTLPAVMVLPALLVNHAWRTPLPLAAVDRIMLGGAAWVALVATDNPIANILRHNIPPFALVRHNMLFFWLVTLLLATVAWRRLEGVIAPLPHADDGPEVPSDGRVERTASRSAAPEAGSESIPLATFAHRLGWAGAGMLLIVALAGYGTRDGTGRPEFALVGAPHLVWQGAIALSALCAIVGLAWRSSRSEIPDASWLPPALALGSVLLALTAVLVGSAARANGYVFPRVQVADSVRLLIDVGHGALVIAAAVFALTASRTRQMARLLIACVMVVDVAIAVPRYYSDTERFGIPLSGWPFTFSTLAEGRGASLFQPDHGDGSRKEDFWQPFTGSIRPFPNVTRLRQDWGDAYETWVHFPSFWFADLHGSQTVVPHEALGIQTVAPTTKRTPTWTVSAANTGGRNSAPKMDTQAVADAKRIAGGLGRHEACGGLLSPTPNAPSGQIRRLLATRVEVTFTSDCERLLIFTDSWAPGWSAAINGTPAPVLRVNDAIRGVMIPPGTHELVWRYEPPHLFWIVAGTIIGQLGALALLAWPHLIARRRFDGFHQTVGVPMPTDTSKQGHHPTYSGVRDFADVPTPHPYLPLGLTPDAPPTRHASSTTLAATYPFAVAVPQATRRGRVLLRLNTLRPFLHLQAIFPLISYFVFFLIVLGFLLAAITYSPLLDGPPLTFRNLILRLALSAFLISVVLHGSHGHRLILPIIIALALPPLALQAARHLRLDHASASAHESHWTPHMTTLPDGWEALNAAGDANKGNRVGTRFTTNGDTTRGLRIPTARPSFAAWNWWEHPLGALPALAFDAKLTATITRTGAYLTIMSLGRLNVQSVNGGIIVTAPDGKGDVRADYLPISTSTWDAAITWILTIHPRKLALAVDGTELWTSQWPLTFEYFTIGDTSRTREHGGTIELTSVRVRQSITIVPKH